MDWETIETRPDEGDVFGHVDGLTQSGRPFTTRRGKIGTRKSCAATQSDGEYGPDEEDFQGERATHWKPLPPAPVSPASNPTE